MDMMKGIPVSYKYWDKSWQGYKKVHAGTIRNGTFRACRSFGDFRCPEEDLIRWKEGEKRGYVW